MLGDKPGWGLKVRVWVEHDGRKVLGPGRVELLGHIDRHRSISAAAKQMNMSYRRAWSLVRDMNEAAGEPLVEATTGGPGRRRGGADRRAARKPSPCTSASSTALARPRPSPPDTVPANNCWPGRPPTIKV